MADIKETLPALVKTLIATALTGQGRDANTAASILLDRAMPRMSPGDAELSVPIDLDISSAEKTKQAMAQVLMMVGRQELMMVEGERLMKLLGHYLGYEYASELERIRAAMEELQRQVKGGVRVIDAPAADVPTWGVAGRKHMESLAAADITDVDVSD